jgi:Zn-dependent protease with chaperone function
MSSGFFPLPPPEEPNEGEPDTQEPSVISSENPSPEPISRQWRNAPRPTEWRSMRSPSKFRLFWVLLATAIASFQVLRITLAILLDGVNLLSAHLQGLLNWESAPFFSLCSQIVAFSALIFLSLSPWIIDRLALSEYNSRPLSLSQLEADYPETATLLQAWRKKHRFLSPRFILLSTRLPLAFAYGSLPLNSRVIVSTGLLQHLTDAELATLYASMLAQVRGFDFFWISGLSALLQIPYALYWQSGNLDKIALLQPFSWIITPIATGFYGIYRFWRLPLLWLSRQRVYYSDRQAVEMTGDANAFCRALLKIANATSDRIQQLGYTPPLLESLDLLLPVDPRQILCLGSLPPRISYESVLRWDCINPYRQWLSLFHSHPLPGERLFLLGQYARFWGVEPELALIDRRPSLVNKAELWTKITNLPNALPLLPRSFLFAFVIGIILRLLFWLTGIVSEGLQFQPLIWMHESYPLLNAWVGWIFILSVLLLVFLFSKRFPHIFAWVVLLETLVDLIGNHGGQALGWLDNRDPFFDAWMVIALSFSVLIWLNGYFPDLKGAKVSEDPDIGKLLSYTQALPSKSSIVSVEGKLCGRKGSVNALSQDLFLETPTGTIELKYATLLGPFGNLLPFFPRPYQYIERAVTVRGWFRRGSSPWIDIDTLTVNTQVKLKSSHQIWLTLLALVAAFWGTYQILAA